MDLTGARAIEIGNQVLFVKEEEDQEAGGEELLVYEALSYEALSY